MNHYSYDFLCFNELTVPLSAAGMTATIDLVKNYARTIAATSRVFGTKHILYETDIANIILQGNTSLRDICTQYSRCSEMILILSTIRIPQINPDDKNKEDIYRNTIVSINDGKDISNGLSAAYINNVPATGFASNNYWETVLHDICVTDNNKDKHLEWPCITLPTHVEEKEFLEWVNSHVDISLVESRLKYDDKKVSLRDDHGQDLLLEHARCLCQCEYVDGILCSLPFKPKFRNYIENFTQDGLVDIVLFWDDRGLAMRIKTTGRNIQETAEIAKILKDRYSK